MKKYVKTNIPDATHIKFEVVYCRGGMNMFTYKDEPRGIYLSLSPVELKDRGSYMSEIYTAFTGGKTLIKEMARKSDKAVEKAWDKLNDCSEKIINLFEQGKYSEIKELIQSIKF